MSLDETLQRLQDAAWEHVSSLPDSTALSDGHLAGWVQVARSAQPVLDALDRPDVTQSLRNVAAALPARPVQRAAASEHLRDIADALRDLNEQLPGDPEARQEVSDVVAVVLQSTARADSVQARDSGNPQVRTLSTELDTMAAEAKGVVADPRARAMPTPAGSVTAAASQESSPQVRTSRRDDPTQAANITQNRGRSL